MPHTTPPHHHNGQGRKKLSPIEHYHKFAYSALDNTLRFVIHAQQGWPGWAGLAGLTGLAGLMGWLLAVAESPAGWS